MAALYCGSDAFFVIRDNKDLLNVYTSPAHGITSNVELILAYK
jgi:hypothetical protein